ncbi:hypothetical protein ACIFOT_20725 [Neobacillus sp. NRS-1170]|uniref:hypothetical protein n=1 Tax=Neobacillus sp. NRS-1170 TaxID=3233898 RepID=UPI003D271345
MSIWIIVISLIFILLIILEETGPYILSQYLNGLNNGKQLKMKKRMKDIFPSFMKKLQSNIHESNKGKSSQGILKGLSRGLKKDLVVFFYKALIKPLRMIKSGYFLKVVKMITNHEVIRFIYKYLKGFSITKVIKKSTNNRL